MNTAAIGGSIASAMLHMSPELNLRQKQLQNNIKIFDDLIQTEQHGTKFPIRLVSTSHEQATSIGQKLFNEGFYVSPVFFPIVAQGKAGLRVMLRSSLSAAEIHRLCDVITSNRML
jgi:7-keto-8-aminopelargonate synthetase-like enzyme